MQERAHQPTQAESPPRARRRLTRWLAVAAALVAAGVGVWIAVPASAAASQWSQVSAGGWHTCGIKIDGTLWCWGANGNGQLGVGDTTSRSSPTRVGTGSSWKEVSAGAKHTCALKTSGSRWCWGANNYGQLGTNDTVDTTVPTAPPPGGSENDWASISAGNGHTCGVQVDGTGWCWGQNFGGQLGVGPGDAVNRYGPTAVYGGRTWRHISAGAYHSCGLDSANVRLCWGINGFYELGLGSTVAQFGVPNSSNNSQWQWAESGAYTSCAIDGSSNIECWGRGTYGQGGNSTTYGALANPTTISVGGPFSRISVGGYHGCGIQSGGTMYCWGLNEAGQLGNNTTTTSPTPVLVSSQTPSWNNLSLGGSHTCGIRSDRTLYCWGYNANGQLGVGSRVVKLVPTLVP